METIHIGQCPVCGQTEFQDFLSTKDHSVTAQPFDLVECTTCGLVITQNHPAPDAIGRYYASEDYISHSDTQQGLVNKLYHLVRKWMLSRKRHHVQRHVQPGAILDIGAGTGYFLHHMQANGWHATGIEPDSGARQVAKMQFGLELMAPDRLDTIEEDTMDAITMWHVLEHVHDLQHYLQSIRRILKRNGVLVIAVPNRVSFDARHYKAFWAGYDVPRHLWHFHPGAMKRLLQSHGFKVVRTNPMWFDALYVSMLSEKYKGASIGMLRGALIGAYSNLRALFDRHKASSVIYVAVQA